MIVPNSETDSKQHTDNSLAECAFNTVGNGAGYCLTAPGVTLTIRRLRRERGELYGELTVACSLPGTKTVDGILSEGSFNLSSIRAREERADHLQKRSGTSQCNWESWLEELCQRAQRSERRGEPAVRLADLPVTPDTERLFEVSGLQFARRHPTVLFADGGSGKSYIGLHVAGTLASELGHDGLRVLLADWEMDGDDHRERFERLFGPQMPRNVFYARCERPLSVEADRLTEIVREENIDYIMCDSIAAGCDGAPEAAEVATRYNQALRQIGVGSLLIAHTNRSTTSREKPFGSIYWHNFARVTCHLEPKSGSPLRVTATQRKNNFGPLLAPTVLEIDFAHDRTTVRQVERLKNDDEAVVADAVIPKQNMRDFILQIVGKGDAVSQLELWHAWNNGKGNRASGPMRQMLEELCERGLLVRDRSTKKYSVSRPLPMVA